MITNKCTLEIKCSSDPSTIFQLTFEKTAFWFWFFLTTKPFLIFLFFQEQAEIGTLAGGFISLAFLLLLIPHILMNGVPIKSIDWPPVIKYIGAYLIWSTCSLFWTQATSKFVAAAYNSVFLTDIFLIGLLMHLGNPRRVGIKSLCGIVTGNTLLAIAILCFAGITADNRLGNSDFLHPNVIGKQMALAGLCSFYLLTNTERSRLGTFLWLTTYILLCSTLLLSLSKTSIIAFFTAQIFMLLMSKPSKLIVSIYSLAIISISFVVFSRLSNYTEDYLYTTQQGKALETVSGRVLVWAGTTEMILSNPWFGHGIMAFRDVGPQVASERLITAHNELLHQWFSYGIIGPIFILLIYSVFFIQLYQIRKHNKYHTEVALSMSLFLFYIIRGFFEAESIGLVFPLPVLLLLIFWLGNLNKIGPEQDLHANDK